MMLLLRKLHLMLYILLLGFFFVISYPLLIFYAWDHQKHYKKLVFIRKWISILAAYGAGIRFKVTYETPINWEEGPYIICPNHTSFMDINAINFLCPVPFSYIGKVELLKNPITRIFFKTIDVVVDRNNKRSAFKALKRGEEILSKGHSLVIFPEGGISDEFPPQLHPFKPGAFRIAATTSAPIIPVVIHNLWEHFWDSGLKFGSKPGTVYISVLRPVHSHDNLSKQEISNLEQQVYHSMLKIWEKESNRHI
ncbi:MAG TPA: 1-acyl-sn-glycerol-3-phosphate acyltransferase [Candidatus Sphingobacterium stercoripullorum]|uniref:1-acyl-sn-glycerol-3-phosphate acyltransferase n=1 Tax=Candidatus Sphingobacterium stercoripullorum TaxID=2838759 RepID=A0A9D1W989_9SPHI|nr:1-acyl-sn-glycerol-3-phosphate acyltransferase [Candidatus Sphingobacterium stercoripullorum]